MNYQYQQQLEHLNTAPNSSATYNSLWNSSSSNAPTYHQTQYNNDEEIKLKLQLKLKENQIESLENEIKILNGSLAALSNPQSNNEQVVPSTVNDIFVKLTTNYNKVKEELKDTKLRLESLITAINLNPSNNTTNNGRYDELEISHKILIKLENLKSDNEALLNNLSFGKMKNFETTVNLLKNENEKLKQENDRLLERLQHYEENSL